MENLKYQINLIKNDTIDAREEIDRFEAKLRSTQDLQNEVEQVKANNRKFIQTVLRVQKLPNLIRSLEQRILDLEKRSSN